jgi:hypothetical protein
VTEVEVANVQELQAALRAAKSAGGSWKIRLMPGDYDEAVIEEGEILLTYGERRGRREAG